MKNFKEIAEKCLVGELSGTFVLRNKLKLSSKHLTQPRISGRFLCPYDILGHSYSEKGSCHHESLHLVDYDIIDFIPNNMKEQMKIDIPEGKVPVMEQTESGVVITWKEKELTYNAICFEFINNSKFIHNYIRDAYVDSPSSQPFYKKVEVLRKLTNIRNYFGKPSGTESGFYIYKFNENEFKVATTGYPAIYANDVVAFAKREHAEQAIKMLGDELKYLFEPW